MQAVAPASLSARVAVAAPVRGRAPAAAPRRAVAVVHASADSVPARFAAAAAAAVLLTTATPAFADSIIESSTTTPEAKAAALKLQAELAAKTSTATRKNFGVDAPSAPRAAPTLSGPKKAGSGAGFSFSAPSFGNPFAGGAAPAPAAKAAEPAAATEEEGSLLPVLLVLFSPLLAVQALQLQTVVRLGTQAVSGTQAAPSKKK